MEKFINQKVFVTANDGDDFSNDFSGTCTGTYGNCLCVMDMDGDVWCVLPSQVEIIEGE